LLARDRIGREVRYRVTPQPLVSAVGWRVHRTSSGAVRASVGRETTRATRHQRHKSPDQTRRARKHATGGTNRARADPSGAKTHHRRHKSRPTRPPPRWSRAKRQ
jgi:hypothetical protein